MSLVKRFHSYINVVAYCHYIILFNRKECHPHYLSHFTCVTYVFTSVEACLAHKNTQARFTNDVIILT